jgi:hypothetical protein
VAGMEIEMQSRHITLRVAAAAYENHDDCLTAAERDIAEELDLVGWDLDPRWEDNQREYILITVQSRHITPRLAEELALSDGIWVPAGRRV